MSGIPNQPSFPGFLLDWGDDGSGLFMKYLRRGSGYYIDVGASQLIIDGKIKLKSGAQVDRLTEDSVVLTDGTELPADLVVYATGYGSMNGWAAKLISPAVADTVGKCWGLGSDTMDIDDARRPHRYSMPRSSILGWFSVRR